jgi:PKD repeat protein
MKLTTTHTTSSHPRQLLTLQFILPMALCLMGTVRAEDVQGPQPQAAEKVQSAGNLGSETVGVPWAGEPGITETVDQIMARQAQATSRPHVAKPMQRHRRLMPSQGRQINPSALPDMPYPVVDPLPPGLYGRRPFLPQVVGTSFLGAQISDTPGFVPPDSMGTVGPTQVMVAVNGRIRIYSKSGVLGGLNADTDVFFASVSPNGVSDPHTRYDRLSQRWFVSMVDLGTPNFIVFAVSSGPVITGTGSFTFFRFQHDLVGTTPNSDTGGFADYDTLGVDRFALYIGANIFNAAGTAFLGTTGYVINKSNLFSNTLTVTAFRQMATASGAGPNTPQGVDNDDPNSTQGYFIGVDNVNFSTLQIRRISTPGGTPTMSANLTINVAATVFPTPQAAKSSTVKLDPLDDRLFAAAIRKNKITGVSSLWTAHNIQVNTSGVASNSGGRNGSRWYEIGSLTATPAVIQTGTLFDSAAANPRGFWIPSVMGSGQGHMALGCSYAGTNDFAGVATAGRLRTDALNSIQAPTLALISATAYNISDGSNPHRWGDFSQVAVDPNDDMTMWTFQEYCNAANSWAIRAIQLKAPLPASPASASPANLTQGAISNTVVISGTSVSGTEFFDPGPDTGGPGYSNHIAAAINGGGITINSVTFSNITNIILKVSVSAGAAVGSRTVTVTNPDGQSSTSASGIITILSAGPAVSFLADPTNGPAPLGVAFTNLTTGATNYAWDFGDGNSSTNDNPSNIYTNAGTYTVSLTAIGGGITNTLTRTNYIVVTNAPQLVVSPNSLDFGLMPTGAIAQASLLVSNSGAGTLSGAATISPSAFAIVSGTPYNVPPAGSTNLTISFAPVAEGLFSNVVVLASNGGTTTNSLLGRAINPPLILPPAAVGTNFSMSFSTLSGFNYLVQYEDTVTASNWQTLQTNVGDGTVQTFTVPLGGNAERYFRLLVQ